MSPNTNNCLMNECKKSRKEILNLMWLKSKFVYKHIWIFIWNVSVELSIASQYYLLQV